MEEQNSWMREVQGRMGRAADSYRELARIFSSCASKKEALGVREQNRILEKISDKVCRSCVKRQDCWGKNRERCSAAFGSTILSAEKEGELGAEQLSEFFLGSCLHTECVAGELKEAVAEECRKLFWFNQMLEGKEALVHQLQETANYLSAIPEEFGREAAVPQGLRQRLVRSFRHQHIKIRQLTLTERKNKGRRIEMTVACDAGRSVPVRRLERLVAEQVGFPVQEIGQWSRIVSEKRQQLVFLEEPEYFTMTGVARTTKQGQETSGDSFSFFYDEDGEMAMVLSDGMGSGEEAAKESELILHLLERLLEAGFGEETAIRLMNSVLALRAEQNSFATLDMSVLNLFTGTCEFIKIGGAATFLRRGGWVECVEARTLPIGMVQRVDYDSMTKKLYDGDYVIMLSDGVLDSIPEEERADFLRSSMGEDTEQNPQVLAGRLLNASLQRQNYEPKDDMTVLVCGMFKKNCHL